MARRFRVIAWMAMAAAVVVLAASFSTLRDLALEKWHRKRLETGSTEECVTAIGVLVRLKRNRRELCAAFGALLCDSGDAGIRRAAAEGLGEIGLEAVPSLIAALYEDRTLNRFPDPMVSTEVLAIEALQRIGPGSLPALLDAVQDMSGSIPGRVRRAILQFGSAAIPAISRALQSTKEVEPRIELLRLFEQLELDGGPAIPLVIGLARDAAEDIQVRVAAIGVLAASPSSTSTPAMCVPALLETLQAEETPLRIASASALGIFRGAAAPAAYQLLRLAADPTESPPARRAAAESLKRIGPVDGLDAWPLVKALRSSDPEERRSAAFYAGMVGLTVKETLPDLVHILETDDSDFRPTVADALRNFGAAAVTETLKLLEKEDAIAAWAENILWDLGASDRAAMATIVRAVPAASEPARERILNVLWLLGPDAAAAAVKGTEATEEGLQAK